MKNQQNALQVAANDIVDTSQANDREFDKAAFELGVRTGRCQSLHVMRAISEAAHAHEIKRIKGSGEYKRTGLNWKQYCPVHLGISHVTADAAIENLATLGEIYFAANKIVPISPATFGLIEGKVDSTGMDIDGEHVTFTAANATRIKAAIEHIRKQAKKAADEAVYANNKAHLAETERDNAKKAAAESRRKLLDALNPKDFADADDDYRDLLRIQSRIDTALSSLNGFRGRELSEDNKRRYVGLCKYLNCEFLRVVDDAQVTFDSYLDPADPGITLALDDPAMDQGVNILAEFASTPKGGR